jgi:hypothetical protein
VRLATPSRSSSRSCWTSIFRETPGIAFSSSERRRVPRAKTLAPAECFRDPVHGDPVHRRLDSDRDGAAAGLLDQAGETGRGSAHLSSRAVSLLDASKDRIPESPVNRRLKAQLEVRLITGVSRGAGRVGPGRPFSGRFRRRNGRGTGGQTKLARLLAWDALTVCRELAGKTQWSAR